MFWREAAAGYDRTRNSGIGASLRFATWRRETLDKGPV
jgi:hypothetical protein